MATAIHSARLADAASLGQRQCGLLTNLAERFAQYRIYRSTLNELAGLSDRELGDLGFHRTTIREVAAKAAYEA